MSRMSMLAGLLFLVALVGAYAMRDVVAPYTDTVGTVMIALAGAVAVAGVGFVLALVAPDAVTMPWDARKARQWAAHCASVQRTLERRAEAAALAAAELDDQPHGLDGTRDGRLIDAAGRFRTLGRFLPPPVDQDDHEVIDAEFVDHEPVDSTTRDRGTAG